MPIISSDPPFNIFDLRPWLKLLNDTADVSLLTTEVAANRILAGPTTGAATLPTFRSMVADDVPAVVWASPTGPIGTTSPVVGRFTNLRLSSELSTQVSAIIDQESLVEFFGTTAGQTITMPLISARRGAVIFIKNRSNQTVTIARQGGSDTFLNAGSVSSVTSFTITTGNQVIITSVNAGNWAVFN